MYLHNRFYIAAGVVITLFLCGYVFPAVYVAGLYAAALLVLVCAADGWLLWRRTTGLDAVRRCSERFSNGDDNEVRIEVSNLYPHSVHVEVIDEIPAIFQRRDVCFTLHLAPAARHILVYHLRPVQRGTYAFGHLRLFAGTAIGMMQRRYTCCTPAHVKVYPSYLMLDKYEFLTIRNNLEEMGIKRIRRVGRHTEFEHIKEYVQGDDYRTINWKATARRSQLMVNTYRDERAQQIYNIVDKGRIMQSAFRGMTLLDYAINAALVLSHVAIKKEDKAGLITFADRFETFVPASRQSGQMQLLMESLYRQQTTFGESDYSSLYVHLNKHVGKRSLLLIYTNFDSMIGMERQLRYLQQLARRHVTLAIFFENDELRTFAARTPRTHEDYFQQVIAEKFIYEKQCIAAFLLRHGIHSLLTSPANLSVDVINKYLEIKARNLI